MTILHILNSNAYSGAENVVLTIILTMDKYFPGKYRQVYIATQGKIEKVLNERQICYELLPKLTVKKINYLAKKYDADIIHAHDFTASVISAFSVTKSKKISHIHNNPLWIKKINLFSCIYALASLKFDSILTVSKSISNEYIFYNLIRKKVHCISNPVSVAKIQKETVIGAEKIYDVIFLGRLSKEKDPERFLNIMRRLIKGIPTLKVIMVGDGGLREEISKKIIAMNLENNISILGFKKNPYDFLGKSKVLCLTSSYEGYGLVAFEALSLKVPAVVSKVGGLVDIIDDSCGKLCVTDEDFFQEIERLILDKEYYNLKSCQAFLKAKKLDNIDLYIKKLKEIYDNLR